MYGNSFLSLSLISNLISVVLVVFILTIAITYYNKRKKKRTDSEIDAKIKSYVNQLNSNATTEYNDKIVKHPELHLLKLIQSGNNFTVYFVNKGNQAFNINISSPDVANISIEPNDNIPDNSSGYIKFTINNKPVNEITFMLECTDELMNKISKKYLISILDKEMKEVY